MYKRSLTIPTPFDDELSYLQLVKKLIADVEEVRELVESYEKDYESYTDEKVSQLKAEILALYNPQLLTINETISNNYNYLIKLIEDNFNLITQSYQVYTNTKITELDSKLTLEIFNLNQELTTALNELKAYTDLEIEKIYTYIDNTILDFKVRNAMTGEIDTIQNVLDALFNFHKTSAIKALEFDNLNLTALQFDNLNLTALQFDFNAKDYL